MTERGVLVVTPSGPLQESDFVDLAAVVDPYLESAGKLRGLMIYVEKFPGWEDFAGLVSHFRFVKEHHKQIERVAAVTDSGVLSVLPSIAKHFVSADIRHFDFEQRADAMEWLVVGD
ncbi:MAG: STAS/SEC14 domain-containing protein [Rubripirellula sp.]